MIKHIKYGYWRNLLNVTSVEDTRANFFSTRYKGKDVLHIGCVDGEIFDPANNLHLDLQDKGLSVDGLDLLDNADFLAKCKGSFYKWGEPITKNYDVVLVPEVLEHVENCRDFLESVFALEASTYFITVPNCAGLKENFKDEGLFSVENIHPEHFYWFSPYTLFNICRKYIADLNTTTLFYLNNRASIGIEIIRSTDAQ